MAGSAFQREHDPARHLLDPLVKLPVILPDLATQQEIADVMTQLENHEQALRRQLELATDIRRDALNGLLSRGTS